MSDVVVMGRMSSWLEGERPREPRTWTAFDKLHLQHQYTP